MFPPKTWWHVELLRHYIKRHDVKLLLNWILCWTVDLLFDKDLNSAATQTWIRDSGYIVIYHYFMILFRPFCHLLGNCTKLSQNYNFLAFVITKLYVHTVRIKGMLKSDTPQLKEPALAFFQLWEKPITHKAVSSLFTLWPVGDNIWSRRDSQ